MSRIETIVRQTLAERALDIPEGSGPRPPTVTRPSHHTRTVLVSVTVTLLLMGAVAAARVTLARPTSEVAAPASDAVPNIRGLLGESVGDALGLEPVHGSPDGCYAFAEYNPQGWGFCMDGVVSGDIAYLTLGRQITGHAPTDVGADYLAAAIELEAMRQGTIDYNPEREAELLAFIAEHEPELSRQGFTTP